MIGIRGIFVLTCIALFPPKYKNNWKVHTRYAVYMGQKVFQKKKGKIEPLFGMVSLVLSKGDRCVHVHIS